MTHLECGTLFFLEFFGFCMWRLEDHLDQSATACSFLSFPRGGWYSHRASEQVLSWVGDARRVGVFAHLAEWAP